LRIPFIDIASSYRQTRRDIQRSLKRLFQDSDFVLGRDVRSFEEKFAQYVGSPYALGVNSGTDALFLGLKAFGAGSGDEVIVPAYTYIASAFAVSYTGARPVFVDIDDRTFNLDPSRLEAAVTKRTKAIMPVHLYGQSADMDPILRVARKHGLKVIEDAAQAHGTRYNDKMAGSVGDIGAFSFYPTKNLGAFGDAGMIVTGQKALYEKIHKLRDYGRTARYEHDSFGYNSRLDSVQAVFLNAKLKKLDAWNGGRADAAGYYRQFLGDIPGVLLPQEAGYGRHVYHIFAIRVKNRDKILDGLTKSGISVMVHYPVPLHLQKVYKSLGYKRGDFPVAEKICKEVLCLPIYPQITKNQVAFVCRQIQRLMKNG